MIKWLWLPVLAVASLPATALADDSYVIGKGTGAAGVIEHA
jgi:hypothetical protein